MPHHHPEGKAAEIELKTYQSHAWEGGFVVWYLVLIEI